MGSINVAAAALLAAASFAAMVTCIDEEVHKLIKLWGDDTVQAQLEGCHRNIQVYERISRDMISAGYERSVQQCRGKAKEETKGIIL